MAAISSTPMAKNLAIGTITIKGQAAQAAVIPLLAGNLIDVGWQVTNLGDALTGNGYGSHTDAIFLSTDAVYDSGDLALNSFAGRSLTAGESYFQNQQITFPLTSTFAPQYLIFVTDADNIYAETNEADNVVAVAIQPQAVDLLLSNATVGELSGGGYGSPSISEGGVSSLLPQDVFVGQSTPISWSVENIGDQSDTTLSYQDAVYFSRDSQLDSSDIPLLNLSSQLEPNSSYSTSAGVTLTSDQIGLGYLLFKTDDYDEQVERDESNNLYAVPVNVIGDPPDFVITAAAVSTTTPSVGQLITASWTVANTGLGNASGSWYDYVYISANNILDDSDALLNVVQSPSGLAVNDSYNRQDLALYLPSDRAGNQYLIFAADGSKDKLEGNEGNNTYAVPIKINAPDLTPTSLVASASTIALGGSLQVGWSVTNQGELSTSGNWYDRVVLSDDQIYDGSDNYLTEVNHSGLANNSSYQVGKDASGQPTLTVNIPTDAKGGSRYLLLASDNYNFLAESNEANNTQAIPITILAPDLVLTGATAPSTAILSQQIPVTWAVKNQGNIDATASYWYDFIYVSSDNQLDAQDTAINIRYNYLPLPVNASYAITQSDNYSITIPTTTLGSQFLLFVTNSSKTQGETDRGNNVYAVPITLTAPDLTVTTVTAPLSAAVGENIVVNWTVTNQGLVTAPASYWYDEIYLSGDTTLGNDVLLSQIFHSNAATLPAGASYAASSNISLPSTAVGNQYILVKTNVYSYQGETNADNNFKFTAIPIAITAPNLTIAAASPSESTLGSSFVVSWTVTNSGTADALANWQDRVYISSDASLDSGDTELVSELINAQTPLAANGSYTVSKNVTVTGNNSGSRYLIFAADRNGNQLETNETDNIAVVPITVNVVDLRADSVSTTSPAIEFDTPFDVSWAVSSIGVGSVNSTWRDRVFLSRDRILSSDDIVLTTQNQTRSLATDQQYISTAAVQVEFNTALPTDVDGFVNEVEPNDSISTALDLQQNFLPGTGVNTYTVKAKGTISTSGEGDYYRFAASPNDVLNLDQYSYGNSPIGDTYLYFYNRLGVALAANDDSNGTANSHISYTLPATAYAGDYYVRAAGYSSRTGSYGLTINTQTSTPIAPRLNTEGDYYLLVQTDSDNALSEGSELNNVAVSSTPIALTLPSNRPDLTIKGSLSNLSVLLGSTLSVGWTVTNLSTTTAAQAGWTDSVYLSDDNQLDSSDLALGSRSRLSSDPALAPGESYTVTGQNVTLPTSASGTKYLLFAADRNNNRLESNENNNINAIRIDIKAPDLTIATTGILPTTAILSGPISLGWRVTNSGNIEANADWYDAVYISSDPVFDSSDLFLGQTWAGNQTPLGAGNSYDLSQTITVSDRSRLNGQQYLIVVTNSGNAQVESNKDNNTVAIPITLSAPDLAVPNTVTAPSNASLNETITVSWQVTNQGTVAAPADWYDRVYLSNDNLLGGDTLIGERLTNVETPLAAGASYSITQAITIPTTATVGNQYLIFVADGSNSQGETDESNNIRVVPIALSAPDLIVVPNSVVAPTTASLSQNIQVSWQVRNQGSTGTSTVWRDRIYLSNDSVVDSSDVLLGERFTAPTDTPLAASAEYQANQTVTIPGGAAPGNRFLLVVADALNNQGETIETNNIQSAAIAISAPDLIVKADTLLAPDTVSLGETVAVNWTVQNAGITSATAAWVDRFYLSNDSSFSNDDLYLGERSAASNTPLAAGAEYTATTSLNISATTAGSRYLIVRTDALDNQGETNENNNTQARAVQLLAADLQVSSLQVSSSNAAFGSPLTLNWTVNNNGTGATKQTWRDRIYLSRTSTIGNDALLLVDEINSSELLVSGSYTKSRTVNLPLTPDRSDGTYYLIAVADADNTQIESNNNNNTALASLSIVVPPTPDLTVNQISAPASEYSGQKIQVNWQVKNQGNQAITNGTWSDAIYLSSNNIAGDSDDIYFGSFDVTSSLGSGATLSRSEEITLPIDYQGNRWVVVRADVNGQIYEHNSEANNISVSSTPINVQLSPFPNLQVTSVTPPTQGFSNADTTVTWQVTNTGTGATNSTYWYDQVWLSQDDVLDAGIDYSLGAVTNPSYLNPNQSYTSSLTTRLPRSIDGSWHFIVKTDAGSRVYEYDKESDNVTASAGVPIILTPPPDLKVSKVTIAPSSPFSGQKVAVTWQVKNTGLGRTLPGETSWSDELFIAKDPAGASDSYSLGRFTHVGGLQPNEEYSVTKQVDLPIGKFGDYFFVVKTDVSNQVFENPFEDNNTGFLDASTQDAIDTPSQVQLTPPPDLTVEAVTAPANAVAGKSIAISYRVANQGLTTVPSRSPAWTDSFYLSTSSTFDAATAINLGSQYRNTSVPFNAGDSYTGTATLTLPQTLASGNYYISVVTDQSNQVFEQDDVDLILGGPSIGLPNVKLTKPITVVARPADLVVSAVNLPSTNFSAGKAARISWTVLNQGTGDTNATSWDDQLVLSRNNILGDGDDLQLATFTRNSGALQSGGTYTRTEDVLIPFEVVGNYSLFVQTDVSNQVYEATNESNNGSTPKAVSVSRLTPDLRLLSVTAPATAVAGSPIALSWQVQNIGEGPTNVDYWYDELYLSTDLVSDGNDVRLGTVRHNGLLAKDAAYTASANLTLPTNIEGNYYIIAQGDRDTRPSGANNRVVEISEDNNAATTLTAITINPVPDLQVSAVDASPTSISGQTVTVNWTVMNKGAATAANWRDGVYLSRDQVLDRGRDIYLGTLVHNGGLAAGASYQQSATLNLPRGISGPYYAFVATDNGYYGNSEVDERTEELNNTDFDATATQIILPPPAELIPVTSSITFAPNGIAGQPVTVNFAVKNQGGESALGSWSDTLYLSADETWDANDFKLGEVGHYGEVAANTTYSGSLTTVLPGVNPGNYHVILRSDIRDQVPETNETNNTAVATSLLNVDFANLTLGQTATGSLAQGQTVYYKLQGTAGQAIQLKMDSADNDAANGLYVRYGQVPTRGQFDRTADSPFLADPNLVVPIGQDGTYYVAVTGNSVNGAPNYTLTATEIPFSITKVESSLLGNTGSATIKVQGARFEAGTTFQLIDGQGRVINQLRDTFKDSTLDFATFDLKGQAVGNYSLQATQTNGTTTRLSNGISVEAGVGQIIDEAVDGPTSVWTAQKYPLSVTYGNSGDTDGLAPVLLLRASNSAISLTPRYDTAATKNRPLQVLGVGTDVEATLLRPQEAHSIPVYFTSFARAGVSGADGTGGFTTLSYAADNGFTITGDDWVALRDSARPTDLAEGNWNGFWEQLQPTIGKTWGDYVKFSNQLSKTYGATIAAQGDHAFDTSELFRELYNQKPNYRYSASYTGRLLDVTLAANNDADTTNDVGLAGLKVLAKDASGNRVGEGISDATGSFTINNLQSGTYNLSINYDGSTQQYFFNQDKGEFTYHAALPPQATIAQNSDGAVDSNGGSLFVRGDGPKDTNVGIVQENNPVLVNDANGVAHLFWSRNGLLVHSYYSGTQWVDGEAIAQLPDGSSNTSFQVRSAGNLIGGTDAGLMLTFQSQSKKAGEPSKAYYALGRAKAGGGFEFSAPTALTNDNISDSSPTLAINNNGQAIIVYGRQNETIQDDTDLYFNLLNVAGNGLTWVSSGSGSNATTTPDIADLLLQDPSDVRQSAQYAIGGFISKKGIRIPLVNEDLDFEGKLTGSVTTTTDDCYDKSAIEAKAALKVSTIPAKTPLQSRNIWKPDVKVFGTLDFSGNLSSETDCGITKGQGEATVALGGGVEVSWSLATLISLILRTGIAATGTPLIIAGPIIDYISAKLADALKAEGIEASAGVEGKASAGATTKYKDGTWNSPVGQFKGEVNAFGKAKGGGEEVKATLGAALTQDFYLYTSDASSFDFSLGKGKLQGQASLEIKHADSTLEQWKFVFAEGSWAENTDPTVETIFAGNGAAIQRTFRFDPVDLIGSTNAYFNNGNSSVLSNVTSDVLKDDQPILAKGPNGEILLASFKNVDYTTTQRLGSEVNVSTLVGNQWSSPTAIANSLGFNQDLVLSYDKQGNAIAVWSHADTTALVGTNFSPTEYNTVTEASDIVYSRFVNGTWSTPTAVAALAGKDNRVTVGAGINGELISIWDHQTGTGRTDHALEAAVWNGTTWTTPVVITRNSELLSTATIGQLAGKTAVFWSQTDQSSLGSSLIDSPETSSHIYYSTYDTNAWSQPLAFTPQFIAPTNASGANVVGSGNLVTDTPDYLAEFASLAGGGGGGGGSVPCAPCPRCKNVYCPPPRRSSDPNDILGPNGYGPENWVKATDPFNYTIRFENQASADAPAKQVVITQQLDADLDWRSFRLGTFIFGDIVIEAPENSAFYSQRFDLLDKYGVYLDVSASIDIRTGTAKWELKAIDPLTGDIPLDPLKGFLPPNTAAIKGQGEGAVTYRIKAKGTAQTGDRVDAKAQIVFDTNEPIDTPAFFNTLDVNNPTSSLNVLPAQTLNPEFTLAWTGSDDTNGSGIAGYELHISTDGKPFELYSENIPQTETTFIGSQGHTYSFYTLAMDNAGNMQDVATANSVTTTIGGPGTLSFSASAFSVNESGNAITAVTVNRTNGTSGTVSATLSLTDGTALGGVQPFTNAADYDKTPITVKFADGETSKVITVPIHSDTLVEGNETVNLSLSNPTGGATLGDQASAVLTIVDGSIQINFASTSFKVNEDGTPIQAITVNRTGNASTAVGATLNLTGGTATAGTDYTATPILVNFAAGQTTQVVTVPLTNDTVAEGDETINLSLSNPTGGAALGTTRNAVLTLVDDDTNLKFNLTPEAGLDTQAITGFTAGANSWAKVFKNSATVNVKIGFRDLGNGLLGQNIAERSNFSYTQVYSALTQGRTSSDDFTAVSNLQTTPDVDLLINRTANSPNGSGSLIPYLDNDADANNTTIRLNRANAKALGLIDANAAGQDALLIFNSNSSLTWDFDPTDGISAGSYDFVGLATHELGHALGFDSGVDVLDGNPPANDSEYTYVSSLDLFRFSSLSTSYGKGIIDWSASNTDKYFSIDGGTTKIASFATGINNGDGQQPQHWKDNLGLGLMDPTIAPGERLQISELDKQAFDVIGWTLTNAPIPRSAHDFNNDGKDDVICRNAATGEVAFAILDGITVQQFVFTTPIPDPNVTIDGAADFNGDSKPDMLLRNKTTGANTIALMDGTRIDQLISTTAVGKDWTIGGVGNFNGDSHPDILWRNQVTGENAFTLGNTDGATFGALIQTTPVADLNWTIGGVGDFDRDGKDDVILRNQATGSSAFALMDGTVVKQVVFDNSIPDINWTIGAVGDYNSNGTPDLVWRNQVTGEDAFTIVRGTTLGPLIPTVRVPDLNWQIGA